VSRKTLSFLLLVLAILLFAAGLVTLVPYSSKMVSDLGYYTLCPFAPWSTLTLLLLGGLCWVLRRHIESLPA